MATQRSVLALLGAFAVLAVLLAAIGLHGVIAYSVSQRTREIGVRIALGAQTDDVMGLVLRQGFALAIAGLAIGVAGSLTATRVLETLLYGVQPQDPVTLGAVGALLFAIAVVASYTPARRAARVDPIDALRAD
jgi:ABC-type antimicrobial peptide transport system permease subunit